HIKAFANQSGREFGVIEIEENTVWVSDALGTKFHILLKIDGDARVVRRRPMPNHGDSGKFALSRVRSHIGRRVLRRLAAFRGLSCSLHLTSGTRSCAARSLRINIVACRRL